MSDPIIQLHWLPVRARVQYKLCTLMHIVHNNRCPTYVSDVVQSTKTASTRGGLRSAESTDYVDVLPRLHTKLSLQSEVSPTRDQPRGTAYPSPSAEHRPRQPSSDN